MTISPLSVSMGTQEIILKKNNNRRRFARYDSLSLLQVPPFLFFIFVFVFVLFIYFFFFFCNGQQNWKSTSSELDIKRCSLVGECHAVSTLENLVVALGNKSLQMVAFVSTTR